jgi:hypothetical protein
MAAISRVPTPDGELDETAKAEEAIDEVLVESFPASDAPPWTLGLERHSAYVDDADEPDGETSKRGPTR